ncbi:hypothetical protein OG613_45510 (plasmid) [Streptomyces sp. NBC_00015]|uniref:hypothetical protein n=1 Tax=unclassified Streptomyces TaxID=2593676 RepID=UPI00325013DA
MERYLKGKRKHPPADIAGRIDAAVRARWQLCIRSPARSQAAAIGSITIEILARFGYGCPSPCHERKACPGWDRRFGIRGATCR